MNDCQRVFERLVDSALVPEGDPGPEVAAHVRSCLDCFRALTELRDAPRLAELLRRKEAAEAVDPGPAFWEALATRTVEAVAPTVPAARPRLLRLARRPWAAALLGAAAAAALVWTLGRRPPSPDLGASGDEPLTMEVAAEAEAGDEGGGAAVDVARLDGPELRRLIDALRGSEPVEVRALMETGEGGIADEIAGLDAPALRRLARSLAMNAL